MSVIVNGKTTVGASEIPTDGLFIYYDVSNPRSYPGSGNIVYNLAPDPSLSGSLFNSPSYIGRGAKSYLQFTKASSQYMTCFMPTMTPSHTVISVAANPALSNIWDGTGTIGGGWCDATLEFTNTDNNFIMAASNLFTVSGLFYFSSFSGNYFAYDSYSAPNTGNGYIDFYYYGYDNNNYNFIRGINSTIIETSLPPPTFPRVNTTNVTNYFFKNEPTLTPVTNYVSANFYLYMLYTRKLTLNELNMIYRFLQNRFR